TTILVLVSGLFWYSFFYNPCNQRTVSVIRVVTSADFKPMAFIDGDDIVGFDIDVVKEIARRLNKQIEIQDMPFELLIPQIQLGSIQLIAAGMTVTPERSERVFFTEPYLTG